MSGPQRRSVIVGTGSELPAKVVTNGDLEKMVDTSDEWITVRTGIKERRVLEEGKGNADMAYHAAKRARCHCDGHVHGGLSHAELRVRSRRYAGGPQGFLV